jgi:predicted metal-binding protein
MVEKEALEGLFEEAGFTDFRWLDPKEIVVAQWVRMKCEFGCSNYGKNASCPPNTPTVQECERFLREYGHAVVFHLEKQVSDDEERREWSREVNGRLLNVERRVFLKGYQKAFMISMDSCKLCSECVESREECAHPKQARPGADALAIDVFSTARKLGYPIEVLTDKSQAMNRYAFLLVE